MPASSSISDNSFVNQWLPWAVSAALVVAMAWWTFVYVVPVFTDEEVVETRSPTAPAKAVVSRSADVGNLNLFGVADKISAPPRDTEVKPTRLKLTLRGILATDDPGTGLAQIQQQKEEKYFAVGDKVFNQATLEEIYADRVILLNDGIYETLLLPEEFLNNKHFEALWQKKERKRVASDYRNLLIQNDGMELIKLFGFKTKFRSGKFMGFVVTALGDKGREMMKVLGIEDGDLIIEVNGLKFSESLDATAQLKDLKNATSINATILRDGQEIPFSIELDAPVSKYGDIPEGKTEQDVLRDRAIAAPSFHDTPEYQEYRAKQLERTTGKRGEVEFDH